MNQFNSKTLLLRANLSKERLIYKPINATELQNFKKLSVVSIAWQANEEIQSVCSISCNFIKDQILDSNSQLVSYQMPMGAFLINNKKINLKSFNPSWFLLVSRSEEIIFRIDDFKGKEVKLDIDIALTISFQ